MQKGLAGPRAVAVFPVKDRRRPSGRVVPPERAAQQGDEDGGKPTVARDQIQRPSRSFKSVLGRFAIPV